MSAPLLLVRPELELPVDLTGGDEGAFNDFVNSSWDPLNW